MIALSLPNLEIYPYGALADFRFSIAIRKCYLSGAVTLFLAPLTYKHKKPQYWLSYFEVDAMITLAKARRLRDYLLLSFMRWGLRVGEIVGHGRLPGLQVGTLRENTAWVKRKYGKEGWYVFPADLLRETKEYAKAARLPASSKVFFLSERQGLNVVKTYAKLTGIEQWNAVGCHRLRAFLATDARDQGLDGFSIRDAMDHDNITDTNRYVGKSSPSQMVTIVERLARRQTPAAG